jgi:hypothetical protein
MVTFILVEYPPELCTKSALLPQIVMDQLCVVRHVIHGWDFADPILLVTAENAATMDSYQALTHHSCLKGPHHADWLNADSYGMYGPPLSSSAVPPSTKVKSRWHFRGL